jgi:hypothetical protein
MKQTGIIMSGDHPKLILEGKKTMTRRVITPHNSTVNGDPGTRYDWSKFDWGQETEHDFGDLRYSTDSEFVPDELKGQLIGIQKAPKPYSDGKAKEYYEYLHVPYNWREDAKVFRVRPKLEVGDRLWVRETYCAGCATETPKFACYKASVNPEFWPPCVESIVKPSLFMPRWASRILLEITEVRAEKLQEITEADAIKEGFTTQPGLTSGGNIGLGTAKYWFSELWDSLNAKRGYGWDKNPWVWVIGFNLVGARLK